MDILFELGILFAVTAFAAAVFFGGPRIQGWPSTALLLLIVLTTTWSVAIEGPFHVANAGILGGVLAVATLQWRRNRSDSTRADESGVGRGTMIESGDGTGKGPGAGC